MKLTLLFLTGLAALAAASEPEVQIINHDDLPTDLQAESGLGLKRDAEVSPAGLTEIESLEKRDWCGDGCDCGCFYECTQSHTGPRKCSEQCCKAQAPQPTSSALPLSTSTLTTVTTPTPAPASSLSRKPGWCGSGCDCDCLVECWSKRTHTPTQCSNKCCKSLLSTLSVVSSSSSAVSSSTSTLSTVATTTPIPASPRDLGWCADECDCDCLVECWDERHRTPAQCSNRCCKAPHLPALSALRSALSTLDARAATMPRPQKRFPCDNGGQCQYGCDCSCLRNCEMSHNPTTCKSACCHSCETNPPPPPPPPSTTTATTTIDRGHLTPIDCSFLIGTCMKQCHEAGKHDEKWCTDNCCGKECLSTNFCYKDKDCPCKFPSSTYEWLTATTATHFGGRSSSSSKP
ncbi:hypothetical protein BDV96DRAFT_673843 [Lophiotrema nucula]|uniref:Uncharacterized protein n=1 Tax=Lophiotrema nucula TaxID=690887 RepID=A0A6A5YKN4_9PLEO|nr:hypothetical protein BDV96DRAFT_673843 [Lophiotrema nucula]